ncbi:hypothetical protein V2I01_16290 [Micromonospora sp. BRA006-A]|nr:hypothetical protein [Micromonospora sp. BRA006-A]
MARVRKRNPNSLVLSNMPQLEMFAGFRPGELAILWEPDEQQQQLRSIVLARVDAASWNKKEWVIFEEAPLPPPAAKSYAPPLDPPMTTTIWPMWSIRWTTEPERRILIPHEGSHLWRTAKGCTRSSISAF